ncbi:MAG TPA: TonB-dependent receptor [Acidobacteriota bacterium]|nr:TonB-dependent receptor [Acidobacteriota bacterium]
MKGTASVLLLALWIVVTLVVSVAAQNSGSLIGSVVDSSQGVIPGASVTLINEEGKERATRTDQDGQFYFPSLSPGPYTLLVEYSGFRPFTQSIQVSSGENLRLSIQLQVSVAREAITVTTGEQQYKEGMAQTATRTATPIENLPFSVQIIGRQVLEDQSAFRLDEALRNVSGTVFVDGGEGLQIFSRGFSATVLRDGFSRTEFTDGDVSRVDIDTANVERVEVLKGPASVLYGRGNPGGTINLVTKRPLATRYGRIAFSTDRFGLLRPSIDLSGPLSSTGGIRYRFNALFDRGESFRDEVESREFFLAPIISWDLSPTTTLTFGSEYGEIESTPDVGLPRIGDEVVPGLPFDRFLGDPSDLSQDLKRTFSFFLDHRLNTTWQWRTAFAYSNTDSSTGFTRGTSLQEDGRTLGRSFIDSKFGFEDVRVQNDLTGLFRTGTMTHQVLFGFEAAWRNTDVLFGSSPAESVDIFNPSYGTGGPSEDPSFVFVSEGGRDLLGFYLQDQISLTENVIFVASARFDDVSQDITSGLIGNTSSQPVKDDTAFSPRVGLVYKPVSDLSLYGNFSRSFQPQNGTPIAVDGTVLEPEEGELKEVGAKYRLPGGQFIATVALYKLERQNVATPDLINPGFQVAVGEQLSRGVELDFSGELIPGWQLIGAYAFTDAEIVQDPRFTTGNRPHGIPSQSFSLWSTYRMQAAAFRGLGFGGGVFYVGRRPGDNANQFFVPSFSRTDATMFYEWENYLLQLNLRNLFNQDILLNPTRSNFFLPGEPFNVRISFSYRF